MTARVVSAPPPLELPLDHPRPRELRCELGRIERTLPPALLQALRGVAREHGRTLGATLLAAFATLLHRLAQADDLTVGVLGIDDERAEEPERPPLHARLIPVRLLPRSEQPFSRFLADVCTAWHATRVHAPMSSDASLDAHAQTHDSAVGPQVRVAFAHARGLDGAPRCALPDASAGWLAVELALRAVERDESLTFELDYNRVLFGEPTVTRWLGHLEVLLADVVHDATRPLGRLELLTVADRAWIAAMERGPQQAVDETRLIHHRVADIALAMPDAIAVSTMTESRCYANLDQRANRIARHLRAAGVRCDVPVGVLLPRELRLPEAMLGVLRAGGGYMPIDPDLPLARLHFLVEDAGLRHVVTSRAVRALLPASVELHVLDLDEDGATLDSLDGGALAPSADDATPESTAFVIYTSGSTGIPKGCRNTHRGLLNFSCSNGGESGPCAGTVVMALAASGFDASVGELAMGLSLGAHLVIVPREIATDGRRLAQAMEAKQARLFFGSPASFQLLIEAGWRGHPDMAVVSGGETLTREMAAALSERCGRVWNVYGPTECAVWVTRSLVSPPPPRVTIGRPMANSRFAVVDAYGERVPVGVAGELFIGGPNVGSGYINRDELTAARFVADPDASTPGAVRYRTGDLVRWLPSGELDFIGRNDDQVKLRGFRIELGEIASRLEALPEVAVAVAMVRPVGDGDHRLIAWVQRTPGMTPAEASMRRHLAAHLPAYMVPQAFVVMDAFPLLTTGKIDRRALPAPSDVSDAETRPFRAPTTPMESVLAAAWARTLRVSRVSVDDNFFDLGGHSLLASQILATLRSQHNLDVPYSLFFDAPTIEQLARAIEHRSDLAVGPPAVPLRSRPTVDRAPASLIQRRLHLLESLDPMQRPALQHSAAWRLQGALEADQLEGALRALIDRHAILRTRFDIIDGVLQQRIAETVPFTLQRFDAAGVPAAGRDAAVAEQIDAFHTMPFDLSVPPLLRALLVRVRDEEHVFVVVQHGLVWDGASFDVFLDDLATAYADLRRGHAPTWAPLPISYADYAAWQAEYVTSDAMARQIAWWRTHLGHDAPVLDLPTDRARPAQRSYAGGRVQLHMAAPDVDALRRSAQREGATLFQFLFTAFHVLLHRYSEQNALVIATPLRNRTRAEVAPLIGPFTNTVAVRSEVHGDQPFADVLRALRADCVRALEHEEMPFELLGREAPEVRALFSMQDMRERRQRLDACRLEPLDLPTRTATNDLMLSVVEQPSALLLTLVYRSELFDADTAETMLSQYAAVARAAAAAPRTEVARLSMSHEVRPEAAGSSASDNVALVQTVAVADAPWPVTWNRRGPIDGATLGRQVCAVADSLRAHTQATQLVARLGDDGMRVVLQLAACAAQRTLVFLHPEDSDAYVRRVAHCLGDSTLAITERTIDGLANGVTFATLARDADRATPTPSCAIDRGDVATLEVTVDTVHLLRHRAPALADAVTAMRDALALSADVRVLDLASGEHDGPPLVALAALAASAERCGRVDLIDAEPTELIAILDELRPTVLVVTADQARTLQEAQWSGDRTLRLVVIGPIPHPLGLWLRERVQGAVCTVAIPELLGPIATGALPCSPMVRMLPRPSTRVVDAQGNDAPAGVRGRLLLAGHDGALLLTAHEARRHARGDRFVAVPGASTPWLAGAARRFGELSLVLQSVAAAGDAAYCLLEDPAGRPRLVAVLADAPAMDDAELRRQLRALLPSWAVPAAVVRLDALPRTARGTLDHHAVPSPWATRPYAPIRRVAESPSERQLAALWQELLGIDDVRVTDNFFALGGHSLLALQCLDQVRLHTGVRLDPRALLFGTLERLAATLDEAHTAAHQRSA